MYVFDEEEYMMKEHLKNEAFDSLKTDFNY